MKNFNETVKQAAQGDMLMTRIDELPTGMVTKSPAGGQHILAHSETGHHHVMASNEAVMYEDPDNELVSYIVVEKEANLVHTRSFNTHETINFTPGTYRINRQREHTPEGYRRVAD